MPLDSTYYKDMKISPPTQLLRDEESLSMLLKERASGVGSIPGLLVNVSKNPEKVLYKNGGIDAEIARRRLIMDSLVKQTQELNPNSPIPPTLIAQKPDEGSTFLQSLLEKLKTALLPTK